jgi:hypothetical protein
MPTESQADVVNFLATPAAHGLQVGTVARFETHGAYVFVAGDDAYKIKRAVAFPYMDYSTRERRHRMILREFDINRALAPGIYLGVVPVTRDAGGRLALGGTGEPVEWALHMRRFDQSRLLSNMVAGHEFGVGDAVRLADAVIEMHSKAAPSNVGVQGLDDVVAGISSGLSRSIGAAGAAFGERARFQSERARACLERRAAAGHVRRCHGDLHLGNIVMWDGVPTPFDAIEFDDSIATIDTLYDLAFLLMDLDHRGERRLANVVLNRYLWRSGDLLDLEGLVAMPLFLGSRGAIRAMVGFERAQQTEREGRTGDATQGRATARGYLDHARAYLHPPAPQLVAVGGFSGTGKSTLAASLAPGIGAAPGAVHLRSDLERKSLAGVAETVRLPPEHYHPRASARVYERLCERAKVALGAGHSVVVDAVFDRAEEREAIRSVARTLGVAFFGYWLTAPVGQLLARVTARTGDASDATPAVVERQLAMDPGPVDWSPIDASGPAEATLAAARAARG